MPLTSSPHKEPALTFSAMFAYKKGSVEDHAHLLCSFLLGFGMDVYVV